MIVNGYSTDCRADNEGNALGYSGNADHDECRGCWCRCHDNFSNDERFRLHLLLYREFP